MKEKSMAEKITAYIEEHLNEDLSLDRIAEELNYSKFYMARTFAKETEGTIYKYMKERRLEQAAKQLVETKKPIVEIAYDAHYNSQQAFCLAFHQMYCCTPQTYRKNGIYLSKQPVSGNRAPESLLCVNHAWRGGMAA